MSHIATYAASLGQVNKHLLKKAMEAVAKKFGGTLTNSIKNYNGENLTEWEHAPIVAGIQTSGVKRGIGVIMQNGMVKFIGDPYDCQKNFSELQKEIEQAYKILALAKALQEAGYELEVKTLSSNTVFVGRRQ